MERQTEIGQKNHNIENYIAKAFVNYLKEKYPENKDFEKLNY
jgi:hypothetical protein